MIQSLAATEPRGGDAGAVTAPLGNQGDEEADSENAFRGGLAPARSIRDAWPWFVLGACCLFLGDVMIRRIAFDFDWVGRAIKRMRGEQDSAAEVVTRLDALRKSKSQVDDDLEKRRASVRFEPTRVDSSADQVELSDVGQAKSTSTEKKADDTPPQSSYTERLLEAKRRARKDQDN